MIERIENAAGEGASPKECLALNRYTYNPYYYPNSERMSLLDSNQFARKRLFGKRVTFNELSKYVAVQIMGNPKSHIPKSTQLEVSLKLGYKDTKSIRSLITLGKELGYYTESTAAEKSQLQAFKFFHSLDAFESDPLIQKWVKIMRSRSRGGTELKGWASLLMRFKAICNTTKSNPEQWITGKDLEETLENGRELMTNFMEEYRLKKAAITYRKNWTLEGASLPAVAYSYSKAARDFMRSLGFNYPEGESGVMSQSISTFHGNYNDVRFQKGQYQQGQEYIIKKWGLDSDIFRWFSVGFEAIPRAKALRNMKTKYTEYSNKKGQKFYIMEVFESKTEHFKKGKWVKYIYSENTQQSIDLVSKRSDYVIEGRKQKDMTILYEKLKEVYRFLGVDKLHLTNEDDPDSGYFMRHPSHALRHCGSQEWLLLSNWNIVFVAKMGWKKSDELIESYGEMPHEIALKVLDEV